MVDYISKNWNTNYSLLQKFKEHLENAVYLPKNELTLVLEENYYHNTTIQIINVNNAQ